MAVVMAIVILSGCDWVKGKLGMATSEDIERMKIEMEQKALRERRIADSIERLRLDSLRAAEEALQKRGLEKRFYVIMGSFKESANVGVMESEISKLGYKPVTIPLKNDFVMVALGGYDTLEEACAEVGKVEKDNLCPYDVWVYDVNQGLHEE